MNLDDLAHEALAAVEALLGRAVAALRERLSDNGRLSAGKIESEQHAAHGLAWLATYVQAIRELGAYARRMAESNRFGETEELLTRIGLGEYLAQVFGGIPMNQGEFIRLGEFGLEFRDHRDGAQGRGRNADRDRQHAREPRAAGRIDRGSA